VAVRWLNSNWVLVAAYLLAALTCLVIALRDRTMAPPSHCQVAGILVRSQRPLRRTGDRQR